jgi:hypothetical protein
MLLTKFQLKSQGSDLVLAFLTLIHQANWKGLAGSEGICHDQVPTILSARTNTSLLTSSEPDAMHVRVICWRNMRIGNIKNNK